MRVRLIIEKELEPFWGAEDLLEQHGGKATDDFRVQLADLLIVEDIGSFLFDIDNKKYEPEIKLEVVDSESANAIAQYIKDLKSTIPIDPDEVVVNYQRLKHVG